MSAPDRASRWLGAVAVIACAVIALANLPAADLPLGWLLAFAVPAAVLARLERPRGRWHRAALAGLLQTAACVLAIEYAPAMSRPAGLACTILPPLAWATARQREADGALSLFLSFCVLLVGVILHGVDVPLVIAYGVGACLALRCSAHLAARTASDTPWRKTPGGSQLLGLVVSTLALALPCLLVGLTVERTIAALPSPIRGGAATQAVPRANERSRSVGLDDSFVLGGSGVLSDLHGEQLVRARSLDGAPVPHDMYLRSGFFAVPGLDRWEIGTLEPKVAEREQAEALRRPLPAVPVEWLEVQRFAGAHNFVFTPPGTVGVRGIDGLVVDSDREWLRQLEGSKLTNYVVGFQRAPLPPDDLPFDPRARRAGLLTWPSGLEQRRFQELLDRWIDVRTPLGAAEAIARGLADRCRYDRQEPTGQFAHALQNFLFADGDRRGYCMHFASAAALLLRLHGVPCRIGVGLYGGDPDPDIADARLYGAQHAHAWVEIPFAGRGYVVFDPTPPAERGQRMPSAPDNVPETTIAADPGVDAFAALLALFNQPWLVAVLLLLALGWLMWPPRKTRILRPPVPARGARRLLGDLLRTLGKAGLPRAPGQTLEAHARAMAAQRRLLPEVSAAFTAYQEVRFGGRPFDAARTLVLQHAIAAATRLLSAADPVEAR